MKVGLLICCKDRPKELAECLRSVQDADLSQINELMIVDDGSTDFKTKSLIQSLNFKDSHKNLVQKPVSKGIKNSLLLGYEYLFQNNDIVINLDGDAVVKPDFVSRLVESYLPGTLLTGFHCTTKNENGTDRHKIIDDSGFKKIGNNKHGFLLKQSVGGINFCIDKLTYIHFMKRALNMPGNFDHNACILAGGAYCLKQSVIQHIGFSSSMGHTELPDTAEDFHLLELPGVTLIGVDSNPQRLELAKLKCTSMIKFGDVVTLHPPITSKEQYSEFCIREMAQHIHTSHALIFQHDGFVNNWRAWDNDWLQYDYIGAPWWYQDGMNVGNGGFCLRSKRLMDILATDPNITQLHPEDHHICRTYRPYLESKYGIKFAPYEVAERFSFEGYMRHGEVVTDQFGVHGNYTERKPIKQNKYVFNQFLSLGDILFLVPMYRALVREGNSVLWPIDSQYFDIAKHFPDVNFVRKDEYPKLPYDSRSVIGTEYGAMLPYRYASENMSRSLKDCMRSKYELFGHDYRMWRELNWKRDKVSELALIKHLNLPSKFTLVNRTFGHEAKLFVTPDLKYDIPVIEMTNISGYTLIDWTGVIELASEVHVANSSIMYLLELSDIKVPIHVYRRGIWGEAGYEYTEYLWESNKFIFH
jgi:hypothetical protein